MTALLNFPRTIELLTEAWDTSGGAAVRDVLWSLYNQHRACQLWEAINDLSLTERTELVQLLLMPQRDREMVIAAIFRQTGELPAEGYGEGRIDRHETRTMVKLEQGRAAL